MRARPYRNKIKFVSFIVVLILTWYFGRYLPINSQALQDFLSGVPPVYSAAIFIFLYVCVAFFVWFAKDIFKIIAALLFGVFLSTLLIWIAEIINAFILFFLARSLGRDFVAKSLSKGYSRLDDKLAGVNFLWLFMFRAVPLVPFRFLDLAGGLTRISFRKYFLAVILGSPLRIFWVQYILAGIGRNIFYNPQALGQHLLNNRALFIFSIFYLILVVVVALKIKE